MSTVDLTKFESTIDNKIIAENREITYLDSYKVFIDEYTSDFLSPTLAKYTIFRLCFNNPSNFNLSITHNNFIDTVSDSPYDSSFKTDDVIFNSKFTSITNNKKIAAKLLNDYKMQTLLLDYGNKSLNYLYDIHISDWKNSTFLSTKECRGEINLIVAGLVKENNIKTEYLHFLKDLISALNKIGVLYQ